MEATEFAPRQNETEGITAHVIWMTTGLSCDGDSVGMTSATNPSLEDIITGAIPGMPKVVIHNQVIAYEVGMDFIQAWFGLNSTVAIRAPLNRSAAAGHRRAGP